MSQIEGKKITIDKNIQLLTDCGSFNKYVYKYSGRFTKNTL